jgi:hypothetical protein
MKTTLFTGEKIIALLKQDEACMSIKEFCASLAHQMRGD